MWKIVFNKDSNKELFKLSCEVRKRIQKSVNEKLAKNPNHFLIPLVGKFSGLYKFRIGDYRLICEKHNHKLIVVVVKIGNRKEVYK